ncbi:methionine--tRNA ligase, mitochondrial [Daktulosphaira vitifoliae]|uniref:methionine--tRNA ligase, mitochondrial n=1 Tax=Daktulosphaira vitifoliae TaxID=58002 RepID=UPI0021A9AD34|nr:methionine--tRNA ligase, mitochondrial [Daktulosphaira vitifoliae]
MCGISNKFKNMYKTSYFITTPIFYVNANPHIGHLYSALIADASARFQKLCNPSINVIFSTGTDEHGLKVQRAAEANKVSVENYCQNISNYYETTFRKFNISHSSFIRTTSKKHNVSVQHFWKRLQPHIKKGKYNGWYCTADETFLSEDQIEIINGMRVSKESGRPVEWTEEDNYKFDLRPFKEKLVDWLNHQERIKPKIFHDILLREINYLYEISLSRPKHRVNWGLTVPGDDTQTIYVWLDALVNYLTISGYPEIKMWPPDVHICGKDILKFHGIYWPIFLLAAGLKLPKQIFVHSHWKVNDEKMSKTKGNVVDPIEASHLYTESGLRYFLLREGTAHSDGNYSDLKIRRILNAELADTMGNLLNRCCGKAINPNMIYPDLDSIAIEKLLLDSKFKELNTRLNILSNTVGNHYEELNFYKGIDEIIATLQCCNRFFEYNKPWQLAKNDAIKLSCVLHITLETLRISALALQPIIPALTNKILNKLNVKSRNWNHVTPSWINKDQYDCPKYINKENNILFKKLVIN